MDRFHGMWHLSAKRHISVICWENTTRETFWEPFYKTNHFVWLTGWVLPYFTLMVCERPITNPSIWKENLTWIVRIRSVSGCNLEGWHTGCRHWRVGNDGRIGNLLKKTQYERGIFPKEKGEFIFTIEDGRIKTLGGDQELKTSSLVRERPIRGESNTDFLEGSLPPSQEKWLLAHVRKLRLPSSRGTKSQTLFVERRTKHYSTEIHWRLQNFSHKLGSYARKPHRWFLEYRWIKRFVWFL